MNHTASGAVAVEAPNSVARIAAETAHRVLTDKNITALQGFKMVLAAEIGCMLVRTATIWPNPEENIRQYVEDYVENICCGRFTMDDTLRRTCNRIGLSPTKQHLGALVREAVLQEV